MLHVSSIALRAEARRLLQHPAVTGKDRELVLDGLAVLDAVLELERQRMQRVRELEAELVAAVEAAAVQLVERAEAGKPLSVSNLRSVALELDEERRELVQLEPVSRKAYNVAERKLGATIRTVFGQVNPTPKKTPTGARFVGRAFGPVAVGA